MGKVLDQLIESHIASFEAKYKNANEYDDEMFQKAKNALIKDFQKDVKLEIISELTEDEKSKIDQKLQAHKTKRTIEKLQTILHESIILAIIVGVLVNQITDIITAFKTVNYSIAWTWLFIVILAGSIWGYVMYHLVTTISTLLGGKENEDENNS